MRQRSDSKTQDMFGFPNFEPLELKIVGFAVYANGKFLQEFDTFAQAQIFCRKHSKVYDRASCA